MTSIFVAKLDYGVTNEELKKLFETFGQVIKVSIPIDKQTGKTKGFAFVEMLKDEEALNAINSLNDSVVKGRQISVKLAENKPSNNNSNKVHSSNPHKKHFDEKNIENDVSKNVNIFTPNIVNEIINKKKDSFKKKEKKIVPDDNRPRTKKMETYKKSGKNNRYFNIDDDDLY